MPDADLRSLERQAVGGDVEAEAALLRARERAGERCPVPCRRDLCVRSTCPDCQGIGRAPLRVGLELAAYCGDEASRLVLGPITCRRSDPECHAECEIGAPCPFPAWTQGLACWGRECQVRAAVAAAELALVKVDVTELSPTPSRGIVLAHRAITSVKASLVIGEPIDNIADNWRARTDVPSWARCWEPGYSIPDAVRVAGEQPVREAICGALTEWVLNKQE